MVAGVEYTTQASRSQQNNKPVPDQSKKSSNIPATQKREPITIVRTPAESIAGSSTTKRDQCNA
jgi:hypothetical protein